MLVEVIGIPGAGKSTLINSLMNDNDIADNYKTWNNIKFSVLRKYIKTKIDTDNLSKSYLRQFLLRCPKLRNYYADYIFNRTIKYSVEIYQEPWGDLAADVIANIYRRKDLPNSVKPYYVNLELDKITRSILLNEFCEKYSKNILLDEGVVSSINTIEFNPAIIEKKIFPNAILFLNTNPKTAFEGIKKREKRGRFNQSHKYMSDNEVQKYLEKKYYRYYQLIEKLSDVGIPILIYNRERNSCNDVSKMLTNLIYN